MAIAIFILRYTPFWSIPLFIIFAELAYIYCRKGKIKLVILFTLSSLFFILCTILYYFGGGPEKATKTLINYLI